MIEPTSRLLAALPPPTLLALVFLQRSTACSFKLSCFARFPEGDGGTTPAVTFPVSSLWLWGSPLAAFLCVRRG